MNPIHELRDWSGAVVLRTRNVSDVVRRAGETRPWTTASGFTYDRPLFLVRVVPPTVIEAIAEHLVTIAQLLVFWVRAKMK